MEKGKQEVASGLPVIATDEGGLRELVVNEQTGFLVAPGESAGIAEKIEMLALDVDLRAQMGGAGRRRAAECFSEIAMVEKSAALYRKLLSER